MLSSAARLVEIIPDPSRTPFRDWPELFGFIAESVFTFIPESCSTSSRNTVRNHPEIAFTLPRIPQSPIDLGLVDVAPDQVAPDTALQRRHTVGIIVGGRPRIGCWEMSLNVANNVSG